MVIQHEHQKMKQETHAMEKAEFETRMADQFRRKEDELIRVWDNYYASMVRVQNVKELAARLHRADRMPYETATRSVDMLHTRIANLEKQLSTSKGSNTRRSNTQKKMQIKIKALMVENKALKKENQELKEEFRLRPDSEEE